MMNEKPISERTKQMVYQALGALVSDLDNLGLVEQAGEVEAVREHLKVLDG